LFKKDEYFEWYNMFNDQRINISWIKLVDNANFFGKEIVRVVDLRCHPPILS